MCKCVKVHVFKLTAVCQATQPQEGSASSAHIMRHPTAGIFLFLCKQAHILKYSKHVCAHTHTHTRTHTHAHSHARSCTHIHNMHNTTCA